MEREKLIDNDEHWEFNIKSFASYLENSSSIIDIFTYDSTFLCDKNFSKI